MDRLVWFILFIVMCNVALEITGVTAQLKDTSYIQKIKNTKDNEAIPPSLNIQKLQSSDVEIIQSEQSQQDYVQQTATTEKSQNIFWPTDSSESRNPILDSIFNIPITTLQAVSELVQNIVGAGRSFFTGKSYGRRNSIVPLHQDVSSIQSQQESNINHERI